MNLARAIARFITSEVLLPATIVCVSVLAAAQLLPPPANDLAGSIEKTASHTVTASVAYDQASKAESGTRR